MIGAMFFSFALSGLAIGAWEIGWFVWMILGEALLVSALYVAMRRSIVGVKWQSCE
jgi:hypothetical protein